jgi:hypothetical protein
VTSDDEPQFCRQGEDHVEVAYRQKEFALAPKPSVGAVGTALTTGAIATGMVTRMLGTAILAVGDVSAHLFGAATCNIT